MAYPRLGLPSLLLAVTMLFATFSCGHAQSAPPSAAASRDTAASRMSKRAEAVGSSCSPEGQWNCMTRSFQRCASGQWSAVMNCASGTICTPSGHTVEFRVQRDGGADGSWGASGSGGGFTTSSAGRKGVDGSLAIGLLALASWRTLAG
ncbi:uncharacterized protein UV8b_03019 [Ustilaginoidea virens]|uniref:Extracellular protein n=1 Tax=Ustilaginoidea virens TaxID=1159556 RepID=A0A8E5HNZ2_USTVR|nr:uncharacterized protein UV8b_03019 [Ustilaginoidea virens]QUC18778.1 hypothetical protein UV8b_03019 [Ustilaginoidea virens]